MAPGYVEDSHPEASTNTFPLQPASSTPPRHRQIKRRAASSPGQPPPAPADLFWLAGLTSIVSRPGFEDAVVSKEAQDDALAAALWLRSAELVGLPA